MKLILAVVQGSDAERLLAALVAEGFRATQINSSGGFLREQNVTLLMGVEDGQVTRVADVVQRNCHARTRFVNPLMPIIDPGELGAPSPIEVPVGGATLFVLPIERFERIGAPGRS